MKHRFSYFFLFILCSLFFSCASVPRESVDLSQSIGTDLEMMQNSHKDLAVILFGRMKDDINNFVDNVYKPYQIRRLLQQEFEDYTFNDPSLFGVMEMFKQDTASEETALLVVGVMQIFVEEVTVEVEAYRLELLTPIIEQEYEVLGRIDQSYSSARYANAVVTGHLSSVHKVNAARENTLGHLGLAGISQQFGTKLSSVSNTIQGLVNTVETTNFGLSDMKSQFDNLSTGIRNAANSLRTN